MPSPAAHSPKKSRRFRLRIALPLLCFICIVLLAIPSIFHVVLRGFLWVGARQSGVSLTVEKIDGAIWSPLTFSGIHIAARSPVGTATNLTLQKATATFSFRNLALRRGAGWFERLAVSGVHGETVFTAQPIPRESRNHTAIRPPRIFPGTLVVSDGDFAFQQGNYRLRFSGVHFTASKLQPGEIAISELEMVTPRFSKTFQNVAGRTVIDDAQFTISDLRLAPDLVVKNISSPLASLFVGPFKTSFKIAGFDGSIQGELHTVPADSNHLNIDISGSFMHLSVQKLGAFLNRADATAGLIQEGKFTFAGSPHALDQATISVWLNAKDFRWGSRQWSSLVGGGTFFHGHLKITDLKLQQAHNEMAVSGDIMLPAAKQKWWQSDFNFDISAHIGDLGALTALVSPRFAGISGKAEIEGSVRGQNESFGGQLILSGNGVAYRGMPFDTLKAAIKLNGNEFQIVDVQLANRHDFLHGDGVINILGNKRYWGEIKASIQDIALYAPLFSSASAIPRISGGINIDWSGDGTLGYHSGAFHLQSKKIRLLDGVEPLTANIEGTYAPGNIYFSTFALGNDNTSLTANVIVSPDALTFKNLRFTQKKTTALEGDLTLPINVWKIEKNSGWKDLVEFQKPLAIALKANHFALQEALALSGRQWPWHGTFDGNLLGDGTLENPKLGGKLILTNGDFPIAPISAENLTKASATITFNNQKIVLEKFNSPSNGEIAVSGAVDLKNIHAPEYHFDLHVGKALLEPVRGWLGSFTLDLAVANHQVSGTAKLQSLQLENPIAPVLTPRTLLTAILPDSFEKMLAPISPDLKNWKIDIAVSGSAAFANGQVAPQLQLLGTPGKPLAHGVVHFTNFQFTSDFHAQNFSMTHFATVSDFPKITATMSDGAVYFRSETTPTVSAKLDCKVSINHDEKTAVVYLSGPQTGMDATIWSDDEIDRAQIRSAIFDFLGLPEPVSFFDQPISADWLWQQK